MTIEDVLQRLEGVRPRGAGKWSARCPAHEDKSPSLSIAEGNDGRILLHDFAGCSPLNIVAALNLGLKDLFTDLPAPHGNRPIPKPVKIDRIALGFHSDLAALDLRLRAERIIEVAKGLDVTNLSQDELDRALNVVAKAHAEIERAKHFEHVADTLRERDYAERSSRGRHTYVA